MSRKSNDDHCDRPRGNQGEAGRPGLRARFRGTARSIDEPEDHDPSAEAAFQNARLTGEVAEIAVKEYEEGIYPQDLQTIQGEIKTAEAEIKNTEVRLERIRTARRKLNDMVCTQGSSRGFLRHHGGTGPRRPD